MSAIPYYPILVYGASLTGLGIAEAKREQVLIVERSTQAGEEFIASYRPGEQWDLTCDSGQAQELSEELKRRNLLTDDGRISVPAVAPVLFQRIRKKRLQVKMLTEIIKVQKQQDGRFEVTLFNASGTQKVLAGTIIDTTSRCLSAPFYQVPVHKIYLNAMLHCKWTDSDPPSIPTIENEHLHVIQGRFPGEMILSYEMEEANDWIAARKKYHEEWTRQYTSFKPWTLALIANAFDIRPAVHEHQIDENWLWFPSAAYANLALAFDAGIKKGGMIHDTVPTSR